jgi:tRNA 2-thiocytidine biosynthesis protein TtcA
VEKTGVMTPTDWTAPYPTAAVQTDRSANTGADTDIGADVAVNVDRETIKLEKRLVRHVSQAIANFGLIEDGDKVMVCVSGGKDSYGMLDVLCKLQQRSGIRFDLIAVNLDQKQPGFPAHVLPDYLAKMGVPFHIETQDTYSVVKKHIPEGKTMCSLCSRLRRGILYRVADELGCTKIALGHHRDDMLQTFFLNMFFGGKLKGMPPKVQSDRGDHIIIRPLAFVSENDLTRWAQLQQFPIIPCTLCGSQENLQRKQIGNMLRDWQDLYPGRIETMATALQNVVPSHFMDPRQFDFKGLQPTGVADAQGDKAFDPESFSVPMGLLAGVSVAAQRNNPSSHC